MLDVRSKIKESLIKVSRIKGLKLEIPENEEFGDFSSNIALEISSKEKKGKKNPRETAISLKEKLEKDKELTAIVEKIEVAGPGFINFFLKRSVYLTELRRINLQKERYGSSAAGEGKTVVIDYSSPNIAKHFSIGHLRSTIIGQTLYNLFTFLGYKVVGDNHLGDWGTQFGVILAEIEIEKADKEKLTIDDLERMYVEFHKNEEANPLLHDKAKEWFKKLEEGDKKARQLWQKTVEISLKEFEKIYDLLGIKIDYAYGESFYGDKMPDVIEELKKKGISQKSKGAQIIDLGKIPSPMVVKSDGTTTYFTRDLATVKFRLNSWDPDIFVYEVGSDQTLHFKQLFETLKLLGWGKGRKFIHVSHGLVRFEHGKMSTRKGKVIKLEEVLSMAVAKAREIIEKSETSRGLGQSEKMDVSTKVGVGAVKYFDLMHHPTSDIIFDWQKIFVLQGNSGPYLQYTVARINSVILKAGKVGSQIKDDWEINPEELSVLRTLVKFPDIVGEATNLYSPNLLCKYLFDLASRYNTFYARHRILDTNNERTKNEVLSDNKHRIIGGENENFRILLTQATGQVLKNGLGLLGIQAPERM